jgi:hypothetical protein
MVFNATFNNISATMYILAVSFLVEEAGLKSKTHWRIAHIHIINNHMIIDDCVTTVKPVVEW